MRLFTTTLVSYRSVMSRISPQQQQRHHNNNNVSVEFSRSGPGLEGDQDQVRINVEAGPDHDYLHPLNDISKYNRVVAQVPQSRLPDYNYNTQNRNRNRNSWGSTLPPQCLDNMHR